MHRDGPAGCCGPLDDVRELGAARDLDAGAVEHPRRLRAERPVHEGLEVADPQERVAEPGRQARVAESVEMLVRQRLPHAERERVVVTQPLPEARGAEPAVLVVHGRHAAGSGHAQPLPHRVDVLVVGDGEVAVAEVPRGLLAEDARRLAARVPLDHAPVDLEVAAGERERRRVEPERVVVVGEERGGNVAGDGVERLLRRRRGPIRVAPAEAAEDATRRVGASNPAERLVERRHALEAHLAQRERPGRKVDVRVREAGQHAAAAEVDDVGAGKRGLVRADAAGHALAGDRQGALDGHARVHRANDAVL